MFEPFVIPLYTYGYLGCHPSRPKIATAHDMMLLCRALIDEGVQAVQPFKGKQLLGAIYGQQCTSNTSNRDAMKKYCKEHGIAIWLPNGQNIGIKANCTKSPCLKPCRPQAALCCKPARRQPHNHAYHQPSRRPQSHCIPTRSFVVASDLLQPRFLDMSFLVCHQLQVVVW